MPVTLLVAAVAAGAIFLIAVGIATSGGGSGVSVPNCASTCAAFPNSSARRS